MPQGPIATLPYARKVAGTTAPIPADVQGAQLTTTALSASLNITAAAVVKATPGRAVRVIILAPGTTSGSFTLNDAATVGAAAAANAIWSRGYADVKAGDVFVLDVPCANGIVVSAVPGGGSPIIAVTYN